ncbi:serine/threonine-protein kinase [Streptomyces sp. NBC_00354]|uniref:serine/threonine-protein kinase n=1 Tax=Streptomyces sp. NBC_00354 TaxID=2975723 RepID=UPI003FA72418
MLVDRYRLHGELGRGGFGTVWKAFDERLQRQVAVKILYRSATESGWSKAAARFWQEAITAGGLSSDHIVVVHDFGRVSHSDGPRDFLVMELLEGRPLSQIVACGVIPINQALSWAGQICRALEAAHRAGVIHRDIKPQNVIVNEDTSRLKVVDFGIAKSASLPLNLTETREVIGSWLYMAPERADLHATVDERSDLYSLGCLLYELLTGHPPFYDPDATPAAILHCHMRVTPPPPSHTRRELPRGSGQARPRNALERSGRTPVEGLGGACTSLGSGVRSTDRCQLARNAAAHEHEGTGCPAAGTKGRTGRRRWSGIAGPQPPAGHQPGKHSAVRRRPSVHTSGSA